MSQVTTARSNGLVGCRRCARVWPKEIRHCDRCGASLKSRSSNSLAFVWFWWTLGIAAYLPANIWPMLDTRVLFSRSEDTIIAGAFHLAQHGTLGIAVIILLASVAIPMAKFAAIAFLAVSVRRRNPVRSHWQHRILHFVEFIGRWSMIDVFVVAILSSLVQFSLIATIKPGPAALAFALSVIFTMLSAQSLDSRLIWDLDET